MSNDIQSTVYLSLISSEYQVELFLLAWAVFLAVPWAVMNVTIFSCPVVDLGTTLNRRVGETE
jgi:hypothetical protein